MAEAPKVFGKPGRRRRRSQGWGWSHAPWDVYYEPGERWHYVEIHHFDCLVFNRRYRKQATALRAAERKLASLTASLHALGVPRG